MHRQINDSSWHCFMAKFWQKIKAVCMYDMMMFIPWNETLIKPCVNGSAECVVYHFLRYLDNAD